MIIWKETVHYLMATDSCCEVGSWQREAQKFTFTMSISLFLVFLDGFLEGLLVWFTSFLSLLDSHHLDFILFSHVLLILLSSKWYIHILWTIKFIPFSDPGIWQISNSNLSIKSPTFEWSWLGLLIVFKV